MVSTTQAQVPTSTPTALLPLSGSGGGVIAFASLENNEWQIYILNADGSGKQQVTMGARGGYEPNWSPDGTKIVFQYGGFRIADIITGEIVRIPLSVDGSQLPNEYLVKPAWSPDGEWIAFLNENGARGDIYLIRPDGTELMRLTKSDDISRDGNLVWSPDGKQLAYSAYRDNHIEIFVMDIESAIQGKIDNQKLTNSLPAVRNLVTSWSPDGSRLAFSSDQDGNSEIYLMNPDGSNVVRLTDNPASDTQPAWSPDGKQIAFSSDRDGDVEIYIVEVEKTHLNMEEAIARRLTNRPGEEAGPVWRPATVNSTASNSPKLEVPQGNPPTLDGVLSPGEWDKALRQQFTDGGELFLMQNAGFLYLGLHENFKGMTLGSVCFEHDGTISILHSSGSLGSAIFVPGEGGWQLTQPFKWEMNEITANTTSAQAMRQAYLDANGWVASLGEMTPTDEIEYQITLPDKDFRLAVAYLLPPRYSMAAWWPAGVSDDCRKIKLLQGNIAGNLDTPLSLQFYPEMWTTITIPTQ
jgi:Tol biopolymer transport system component